MAAVFPAQPEPTITTLNIIKNLVSGKTGISNVSRERFRAEWSAYARKWLPVDLASMRDPRHVDCFGRIVNLVDNAVITDSNTPFLISALELLTSWWPRSHRKTFEMGHNASNYLRGQPIQFFFRACG